MFPGQGAQRAGMGADLVEQFPSVMRTAEHVDHALGALLSKRMLDPNVRNAKIANWCSGDWRQDFSRA